MLNVFVPRETAVVLVVGANVVEAIRHEGEVVGDLLVREAGGVHRVLTLASFVAK